MFPLVPVSLFRGFSGSGSEKLLNNRSSEAAGRRWHLSSVTVEPPFPCQRPDKPVSHIYDPLSVVTSVWLLSPAAWPSDKHWGFLTWTRPLLCPCRFSVNNCTNKRLIWEELLFSGPVPGILFFQIYCCSKSKLITKGYSSNETISFYNSFSLAKSHTIALCDSKHISQDWMYSDYIRT